MRARYFCIQDSFLFLLFSRTDGTDRRGTNNMSVSAESFSPAARKTMEKKVSFHCVAHGRSPSHNGDFYLNKRQLALIRRTLSRGFAFIYVRLKMWRSDWKMPSTAESNLKTSRRDTWSPKSRSLILSFPIWWLLPVSFLYYHHPAIKLDHQWTSKGSLRHKSAFPNKNFIFH
jgi:hypothetical protein